MILTQYYLGCLSHGSYLIADEGSRRAVVVDADGRAAGVLAGAPAADGGREGERGQERPR